MKSAIPKPLHQVAGLSLLAHSIASAQTATSDIAVVVGAGGDMVSAAALVAAPSATIHEQTERLGTAHAVLAAEGALTRAMGDAVILYADTPMISAKTLDQMRQSGANGADVVILG
ncbi:NTP transferase domain-containing protein, partial [Paracoccaceae bacterium]|nr:NTP transferase domain-containing protein [Paracoccaceae bacterium]